MLSIEKCFSKCSLAGTVMLRLWHSQLCQWEYLLLPFPKIKSQAAVPCLIPALGFSPHILRELLWEFACPLHLRCPSLLLNSPSVKPSNCLLPCGDTPDSHLRAHQGLLRLCSSHPLSRWLILLFKKISFLTPCCFVSPFLPSLPALSKANPHVSPTLALPVSQWLLSQG